MTTHLNDCPPDANRSSAEHIRCASTGLDTCFSSLFGGIMSSRSLAAALRRAGNQRIAVALAVLSFVVAMPLWSDQVTFGVPSLPAGWFTIPWSAGGVANITGGNLVVDGARVGTNELYAPGALLEFEATFSGDSWQHIVFVTDYGAGPWIIFSTFRGSRIYARTNAESGQIIDTPLS